MSLKAIIFDLDGLLADTETLHWQAWNAVLKRLGAELPKHEYHRYAGFVGPVVAEMLVKQYALPISPKELFELKLKRFLWIMEHEGVNPMPYANFAINHARQRGLRVAVASGGTRKETDIKLTQLDFSSFVESVVTRDEVGRGKPWPDVYLKTLENLRLDKAECVALEDTAAGVLAAKRAGLKCYAIPNEFSQKQDFSHADGVFSDLKEAILTLAPMSP
jgi:HAD superfamily hydrolase (TIGR01509 family)